MNIILYLVLCNGTVLLRHDIFVFIILVVPFYRTLKYYSPNKALLGLFVINVDL